MAGKLSSENIPDLQKEMALLRQGYLHVAGLDEAGRGAWAGPVVAAAVILPPHQPDETVARLAGLRDSKQLSPAKREQLFERIHQAAVAVGVGMASAEVVDAVNVLQATKLAMQQALEQLGRRPDFLLLDHVRLPAVELPQDAFPKADSLSLSVAAASVVAKVTRDRLMVTYHRQYPAYAFDRHKGYGTAQHQAALKAAGPCPLHRMSYSPLRQLRLFD